LVQSKSVTWCPCSVCTTVGMSRISVEVSLLKQLSVLKEQSDHCLSKEHTPYRDVPAYRLSSLFQLLLDYFLYETLHLLLHLSPDAPIHWHQIDQCTLLQAHLQFEKWILMHLSGHFEVAGLFL
jgi:hypothetical protein